MRRHPASTTSTNPQDFSSATRTIDCFVSLVLVHVRGSHLVDYSLPRVGANALRFMLTNGVPIRPDSFPASFDARVIDHRLTICGVLLLLFAALLFGDEANA